MFKLESGQHCGAARNSGGHNSGVPKAIRLVIELDLDISPTNTFMKFGGNWMRNVQVRERTKLKWPILTNSGGHNSGVP